MVVKMYIWNVENRKGMIYKREERKTAAFTLFHYEYCFEVQ
jgi:hypothetical protein